MTTQGKSLEELGRRAVACKHWRWMDGMAANELPGYRIVSNNCEGRAYLTDGHDSQSVKDCSPDLTDPATLGCLLHLVRKAWGDADLSADRVSRAHDKLPDLWQVYVFHESGVKDVLSGRSEIEALVAALEAAP